MTIYLWLNYTEGLTDLSCGGLLGVRWGVESHHGLVATQVP